MRKLLYIVATCALCWSCNLDLEPRNATTLGHFFRTEEDLYSIVAEMHGTMRENLSTVTYHEHMGLRIDRVISTASAYDRLRNLDPNTITSPQSQEQWKRYYNVLTLADLFEENYQKVKNVPSERINFCLGQAYFLRAVNYFWLARIWGDAVITKGSGYSGKYSKTPAKAVVDTAIFYALKAYDVLPKHSSMKGAGGKALTSKQYGNKGNAAAILAHLYAWKGSVFNDNEALGKSITWSSKLIDPAFKDEIGEYVLAANPEEVCQKSLVRGGAESIFELEISYVDGEYATFIPATFLLSYPVKRNTAPQDVLNSYYGIYLSTVNDMYGQNDKRRTAYFYEPDNADIANSEGLAYVYKWRYPLYTEAGGGMPASFRNLDCNKVLIRLADIYLLRAECRVKTGDNAGAVSDLNAIRLRADAATFPDANKDEKVSDLQRIIFREREKELLFEGGRYYDVVRNGYAREELEDGFRTLTDADIASGALYLPVPKAAFNNNDLMIQNEYWLSKMK